MADEIVFVGGTLRDTSSGWQTDSVDEAFGPLPLLNRDVHPVLTGVDSLGGTGLSYRWGWREAPTVREPEDDPAFQPIWQLGWMEGGCKA